MSELYRMVVRGSDGNRECTNYPVYIRDERAERQQALGAAIERACLTDASLTPADVGRELASLAHHMGRTMLGLTSVTTWRAIARAMVEYGE